MSMFIGSKLYVDAMMKGVNKGVSVTCLSIALDTASLLMPGGSTTGNNQK